MADKNLIPFNCIVNTAGKNTVDVHIDGLIVDAETQAIYREWFGDDTTVSFKSFRDQINAANPQILNIYINSGGGHLIDAMAMHDYLKDQQRKGVKVNTFGRGLVASASTYILMVDDNAEMAENAWFMIHNVSGGASGTVDEIEAYAKTLRKFNNSARDFYASRTGKRPEEITKMMNAETWLTAAEARDNGFIKQVTGQVKVNNKLSADQWAKLNFKNTMVLNAYNLATEEAPKPDFETSITNKITDTMNKFLTDVMNAIKGVKPAENAKPEDIVNSLVTVLQPLFEAVPEPVPVDNTAAINTAVNTAMLAAATSFNAKLTELETTNTALVATNATVIAANKTLTNQIELMTGKKHAANKEDAEAPVVGSFSSKKTG